MSREIDLTKPLSESDKKYLMQRGREYDVQQNEILTGDVMQVPHTGDVDITLDTASAAGITQNQQQVQTTAASVAAAAGMPGIVTEADPGEFDAESLAEVAGGDIDGSTAPVLEAPYDREGVTKKMLVAEIRRRNALPENAEYEDIPASGDKDALVAALVEDDEASA